MVLFFSDSFDHLEGDMTSNSSSMTNETHKCSRCGQIKPISEFYIRKSGSKTGRPGDACKICTKEKTRQWYRDHPEKTREKAKIWREKHPERVRSIMRVAWRKWFKRLSPEKRQEMNRKRAEAATCRILRDHASAMRDDPEHLSTDFILQLARIKKPKVSEF